MCAAAALMRNSHVSKTFGVDRAIDLLAQAVERYPDKVSGASWLPARLGGSAPTLEEAEVIEVAAQLERAAKRAQKKS